MKHPSSRLWRHPSGLSAVVIGLAIALLISSPLAAREFTHIRALTPFAPPAVMVTQANCAAAAARVARGRRAQVAGVRMRRSGERVQCVVTLVVPDPNGRKPPRRMTVTVPAGAR